MALIDEAENKRVNSNSFKQLQIAFPGLGCWLTIIALAWLLGAVGLGWLVKFSAILLLMLFLAPVVAFVGIRWWLQRNLVQSPCPVCSFGLTGLAGVQSVCPSCGTALKAENGAFHRVNHEGSGNVAEVVDVEAVEVSVDVLPPEGNTDHF